MTAPRMHINEGVRFQKLGLLDRALQEYAASLDASQDPAITGEAHVRRSHVYRAWCRWDDAISSARRGVEIARDANLASVEAEALNAEAIVHQELGRFDEAVVIFERILGLDIDERLRGIAFQNLGSIAAQRSDLARAEDYFRSSYGCFGRAGYRWGEAFALTNFGAATFLAGKFKEAEVIGNQAILAAKKVGDLELVGIASMNTGEALAYQKEFVRAQELASEALGYFLAEANDLRRAQCLRVMGDIRLLAGDPGEARLLYQQAYQAAEQVGSEREMSRLRDCLEIARGDDAAQQTAGMVS